jgi:putative transposase
MADHRSRLPVRVMCRSLRIRPSGFYAWLHNPMSKRAKEEAPQIELIRKAWKDSSNLYDYPKLHDDLVNQGDTCCPNKMA